LSNAGEPESASVESAEFDPDWDELEHAKLARAAKSEREPATRAKRILADMQR
jgi:hypothetical protein